MADGLAHGAERRTGLRWRAWVGLGAVVVVALTAGCAKRSTTSSPTSTRPAFDVPTYTVPTYTTPSMPKVTIPTYSPSTTKKKLPTIG